MIGDEIVDLGQKTLEAIARGRVDGPSAAATGVDMAVEQVLGAQRTGVFTSARWRRMLEALAPCSDVRLDDEPVRCDTEPLRPRIAVEDVEEGFRLRLLPAAGVRELLPAGLALCEDGHLRAFGGSGLDGRELEDFRNGKVFGLDDAAELATEIVPSLQRRIEVELRTDALPKTTRALRPRLLVETERRGNALSLLPLLVYGDPPVARIDGDRLVPLEAPDARTTVPTRDRAAEAEQRTRLADELGIAPGRRIDFEGEEALAVAERLERSSAELAGDGHLAFERRGALTPQLRASADDFALWFASEDEPSGGPRGGGRVSGEAVVAAWQRGERFVALEGGGFAPLPSDWLQRFGRTIGDLLAARREDGSLGRAALPELGRFCEEAELEAPTEVAALRAALQRAVADDGGAALPEAPLPEAVEATLRDYQRRGVDWMVTLAKAGLGALLADDMGLGKTLQTLCAIRGRTLVVAPTSVLHAWRVECERFRPDLRVNLFHGAGRALDPEADVTLTSYALLRIDVDALSAEPWDSVVLDEAQAIKNADSQVARAAARLRAEARFALTGTPIENRLEELWSQFHFLNPGWLGSRRDFQERYAAPIAQGDAGVAEHLRARIRPFVLRRLKEEVAAELPPRSDVVVTCELDPEERRVYDAVAATSRREVQERLGGGGKGNVIGALEALLRVRQAACHTGLVPGQESQGSTKVSELVDRLEITTGEGHAALVFSQWTAMLDRIEPALREANIAFVRLDGATRDRSRVIDAFQAGEAPVMLVSLKAGGAGLTLTAADHVFLMDPWWNPAVEEQAAARAHRIGQNRPVFVHRLIAANTVEERILALHAHKRALFDSAMAGSGDGITPEDLLALVD